MRGHLIANHTNRASFWATPLTKADNTWQYDSNHPAITKHRSSPWTTPENRKQQPRQMTQQTKHDWCHLWVTPCSILCRQRKARDSVMKVRLATIWVIAISVLPYSLSRLRRVLVIGTVKSVRKVIPAALAGRVKRQAHLWIDTIEKNWW